MPPGLNQRSIEWLVHASPEAVLMVDTQGCIVQANTDAEELFGFPHDGLVGHLVESLFPQRYASELTQSRDELFQMRRARRLGVDVPVFAHHRLGREIPVEAVLTPLRNDAGQLLMMVTVQDVSELRAGQAALQESEARMRAVFETAVEAIVMIEENGLIDRFNPAAEHLFGYAEAEVKGRNVSILMPSPYREMHDKFIGDYCSSGVKKIIGIGREVVGLRRDGSTFPMDLAVAEMRFSSKRMFTGVIRDISERRRAEEALRQSQAELRLLSAHQEKLKEEERKRIAQEIHDELGAQLTGIKAYVSVAMDRAVRAGQEPDPLLAETAELAGNAISTVRKVISDLRPSVLDQLGVWAAIEWYSEQIEERSGLRCECEISASVHDVVLDPDRSTMVFRVVQEALTNVVRHAEATRARLVVEQTLSHIQIRVEDDGKGIDTERLLNRESWGLLGMYERSRHFGCELRISGTPGAGTTVLLQIPLESLDG